MLRLSDPPRLVCDTCGTQRKHDVRPGQACPLCLVGRLRPLGEKAPPPRDGEAAGPGA